MAFEWEIDKELEIGRVARLRLLQRHVGNLQDFREDLVPFSDTRGVWIFTDDSGSQELAGVLTVAEVADHGEHYGVSQGQPGESLISFVVDPVQFRQLTIWRVDDQLDMIQIRIGNTVEQLYGQIGGERSMAILLGKEAFETAPEQVATADHFYRNGTLPRS